MPYCSYIEKTPSDLFSWCNFLLWLQRQIPPFLTCQLSFNWTCNNYKNNTNKYLTTIMHPLISSAVYGSDPSFIFSTATSANPREHCMVRLETDRNFMVVSFCSLYCSIACKYFFYVLFLLQSIFFFMKVLHTYE